MDALQLPQPGALVAGKYLIEREIGRGGMGAVFAVSHRVTGRRFAIKWLLPLHDEGSQAELRFVREAQISGRLQHPNIVEVFDIGVERGAHYLLMELLEGESLAARLRAVHHLPLATVLSIVLPCLRAVAAAHDVGVIHRDLKPENIFLCRATAERPELPKVLDFGISKLVDAQSVLRTNLTDSGMAIGTPGYMSLEQLRGAAVDLRADVYAFGVMLYELLSGERPFRASTLGDLVLQAATITPPDLSTLLPDLPAGMAALVARAMARDADARFRDLRELARALEPYAGERAGSAPPARLGRDDAEARLPERGATARWVAALGDAPRQAATAGDGRGSLRPARRRAATRWLLASAAVLSAALLLWRMSALAPSPRPSEPPRVRPPSAPERPDPPSSDWQSAPPTDQVAVIAFEPSADGDAAAPSGVEPPTSAGTAAMERAGQPVLRGPLAPKAARVPAPARSSEPPAPPAHEERVRGTAASASEDNPLKMEIQ